MKQLPMRCNRLAKQSLIALDLRIRLKYPNANSAELTELLKAALLKLYATDVVRAGTKSVTVHQIFKHIDKAHNLKETFETKTTRAARIAHFLMMEKINSAVKGYRKNLV